MTATGKILDRSPDGTADDGQADSDAATTTGTGAVALA